MFERLRQDYVMRKNARDIIVILRHYEYYHEHPIDLLCEANCSDLYIVDQFSGIQ